MGDDEILQLFFHRVEYAISAVEEKYGRLCRSVARGILKDERDVEECVNDTCMRAWNAIPPEKPRSLEAYLVRITRNLALDRYAYHHSQKRETALTEAYEELEACLPLAKDGPEEAAPWCRSCSAHSMIFCAHSPRMPGGFSCGAARASPRSPRPAAQAPGASAARCSAPARGSAGGLKRKEYFYEAG